jgi:hypothetical protein
MDINEVRIQFKVEDINLIFQALDKLPYGEVYPLVEHLKKIIDPQLPAPEMFINTNETSDTSHPFE